LVRSLPLDKKKHTSHQQRLRATSVSLCLVQARRSLRRRRRRERNRQFQRVRITSWPTKAEPSHSEQLTRPCVRTTLLLCHPIPRCRLASSLHDPSARPAGTVSDADADGGADRDQVRPVRAVRRAPPPPPWSPRTRGGGSSSRPASSSSSTHSTLALPD
jgi:hypothetical protein